MMQVQLTRSMETTTGTSLKLTRRRLAAVVGLGVLLIFVLPLVPIVLGMAALVLVAINVWLPELRPYVRPVLCLPVGEPKKRNSRLALRAGAGILLVVLGSTAATLRGSWRGTMEQRAEHESATTDRVDSLFGRAEELLASGDIAGAELALLDARAIEGLDSDDRDDIDDVLDRIRRSGDSAVIATIVAELSEKEVAELESGESVPEELDFGEEALTYQAVELALSILHGGRLTVGS